MALVQIDEAKTKAIAKFGDSKAYHVKTLNDFLGGFENFCKNVSKAFPKMDFLGIKAYEEGESTLGGELM